MIHIIMLALFVEAIVSALKPIWKDGGKGLSVTEIVSIVIGVVLAVAMKIDLFRTLVEVDVLWETPSWVDYVFYAMSGVAIGRGPSFIYDLWENIKKWSDVKPLEGVTAVTLDDIKEVESKYGIDLNIENWSVAQLREFCILNDIPAEHCKEKDEYLYAIEHGGEIIDGKKM